MILVKPSYEILTKREDFLKRSGNISVGITCDREMAYNAVIQYRFCSFNQENIKNDVVFVIPSWVSIEPGMYNAEKAYWTGEEEERSGQYVGSLLTDMNDFDDQHDYSIEECGWFKAMARAEYSYLMLLRKGRFLQEARPVLPNSLKTEIVMTANIREWLNLKASEISHLQMREMMISILRELKENMEKK